MSTENNQNTAQNDTKNEAEIEEKSLVCCLTCDCQTLCQPLLKKWLLVMAETTPGLMSVIQEISNEAKN